MKATGKIMEAEYAKQIAALIRRVDTLERLVGKMSDRLYRQEINNAPCCASKTSKR